MRIVTLQVIRRCCYWYNVLEVEYDKCSLKNVKVQWEDGKVTNHCTNLNTLRDYELIVFN